MSEASIRNPAKKVVRIPKNANGHAKDEGKQAREATTPTAEPAVTKPAPTKVAKQKRGVAAEPTSAAPTAEVKVKRAKKEKVVRDSFTMPKSDYEKIAALKQKCLEAGVSVKKSEILRAGLLLLESATSKRLLAAISAVETVKTGRPAKS